MKMLSKIATGIVLWLLPILSSAQNTLVGKVVEGNTGKAIPYVNIYLPELNKGTGADSTGAFEIKNIPEGDFNIEFSSIGYAKLVKSITIAEGVNNVTIKLSPSIVETKGVVIYGTNIGRGEETPNDITTVSQEDMRESGALGISDAVAKLPGVNQLSTGAGISKPVVRGLYGNRIQIVMMGMRFDNQQWQDEHGLGLQDVGVDRVEILKGPVSLLYGSEAMGGVLNIIEEKPAPVGTIKTDASFKYFSNTLGLGTDVGVKGANDKRNWRIRIGAENHADYSDGNNNRVLNSRFNSYNAKASIGFKRKHWVSQNNYVFSYANYAFLLEAGFPLVPDERYSRSFDKPHHTVLLNMLTSQNTFFKGKSKIKVNVGLHTNNRQEQEGGNKISLDMILNTYTANVLWVHPFSKKTELSIGTQDMYQTNRNFGARTIVPDANMFESSLFSYVKHKVGKWLFLEGGVRYDKKNMQTFTTGIINSGGNNPGNDVLPFNRWFDVLNGSLGGSFILNEKWNVKANFSSGYRAANLAELSSNGLHEGTLRYEIGDIDLKVEQNFCEDITLAYQGNQLAFSGSVYNNRFVNYIYLAPTNTEYLGLDIYRYLQKDATLQGGELMVDYRPAKLKLLDFNASYSSVVGKTDAGEYLPFIPANKLQASFKLKTDSLGKLNQPYFKAGITSVNSQTTPAQFETSTPAYLLVNAGIGAELKVKDRDMIVSVVCNNLLNETYYDHLSRFKYFGIYNIGRNVAVNIKYTFK